MVENDGVPDEVRRLVSQAVSEASVEVERSLKDSIAKALTEPDAIKAITHILEHGSLERESTGGFLIYISNDGYVNIGDAVMYSRDGDSQNKGATEKRKGERDPIGQVSEATQRRIEPAKLELRQLLEDYASHYPDSDIYNGTLVISNWKFDTSTAEDDCKVNELLSEGEEGRVHVSVLDGTNLNDFLQLGLLRLDVPNIYLVKGKGVKSKEGVLGDLLPFVILQQLSEIPISDMPTAIARGLFGYYVEAIGYTTPDFAKLTETAKLVYPKSRGLLDIRNRTATLDENLE